MPPARPQQTGRPPHRLAARYAAQTMAIAMMRMASSNIYGLVPVGDMTDRLSC
jgi:hypothetical protein